MTDCNNTQQENDHRFPEPITLRVGPSIKHRRIDKYLHGRFSNYSRSAIQKAIKQGKVKINGRAVKASYQLSPGEQLVVSLPELAEKQIEPQAIPLNIIHEDDDIIILNKQADIIVHPARGNTSGTLVNALAHRYENLSTGLGALRPGIVHRLDKNTTGVMVVTKNDEAQWNIARQFQNRTVKKSYLAIVHGTPDLDADRISAPLGIHPRKREKYAIRPQSGKESVTFYQLREAFRGFSLMELFPKTGRTHQIRVHLSHLKHPIVADEMYGGKLVYPWQLKDSEQAPEQPIIRRCALHAYTIEFRHPSQDKSVRFEAPLPEDMKNLLELLRKYRSK
jgi:23S rRNA pseudouridine1911/1915/1917 synthase